MESESPAYGHEELKKMHDHGFGRAVMGFRTTADARRFLTRWRALNFDQLRALYPQLEGADDDLVRATHLLVQGKVSQQGIGGLLEAFEGSANALERTLKAGLDAVTGSLVRGGGAGSAATSATVLVRDITLDVYIFGTGPTGVPDFDHFVAYRQAKAIEYHLNRRLEEKLRRQ
ncbi:MAG: hypothetical protein JJU06_21240 [Ectothiorhodospiraceae bacterium]|nr:hypothetical protein [Ectothiorhodospiraceae bacterium]MCH8505022.1 hypothetical protein [Ectothiorhodospiraceae bacterium]